MSVPQNQYQPAAQQNPVGSRSKIVAGILGILLGFFGAHSFYLGDTKKGIIQLVVSVVTFGIGSIWGFVEGIMILVSKPGDPRHKDADGLELQD